MPAMSRNEYDNVVTRYAFHNSYTAKTEVGFTVRYTITCWIVKMDAKEFWLNRLLEEGNQRKVVDQWHTRVFLPQFAQLRCSFKYFLPWDEYDRGNPSLCWIKTDGEGEFLYLDFGCYDLSETLRAIDPIVFNGCSVEFGNMELDQDKFDLRTNAAAAGQLIQENYNIMKLRSIPSPENTESFRRWEEAAVVTMLNRRWELEKEFQTLAAEQDHKSKMISVKLRVVGESVELTWDDHSWGKKDYIFRGYRLGDEVGHSSGFDEKGPCIIETQQGSGKVMLNLREGKEYIYTFILTHDEPQYGNQTLVESVFSSPPIKGYETRVADTLRFTVKIPNRAGTARIEQLLANVQQPIPDPKKEKINRAFQELSSFVEFDESLTQWETHFLRQIEGKGYSPEEKSDKIEKIKSVVESLRVQSMP